MEEDNEGRAKKEFQVGFPDGKDLVDALRERLLEMDDEKNYVRYAMRQMCVDKVARKNMRENIETLLNKI